MKKLLKMSVTLFMLILIVFNATACFGPDDAIVYLDGGTLPDAYSDGATLEQIAASTPSKEGAEFVGWYSDNAFTDYINPGSVTNEQKDKNVAYAKWITVKPSQTYDVRKEEATITDSGRKNQKLDIVPISDDYNIKDMMRVGYKSFKIEVTLDIREVDDGYQYVFLYKDTNCPSNDVSLDSLLDKYVFGEEQEDPSLLYTYKHEHTPSSCDTSWKTTSFTTTVSLSSLKDNLYIRYGASGNKDDTWINTNISVVVTPVK